MQWGFVVIWLSIRNPKVLSPCWSRSQQLYTVWQTHPAVALCTRCNAETQPLKQSQWFSMTQGSPWKTSKLGNCNLLSPCNFLWRSYSSNLHLVKHCITVLCALLNSFQKMFVLLAWGASPFMWSTNDGKLQNKKVPLSVFNIKVPRIYRCWLGRFGT